jgi:predicted nucleic acid-binding protein
VAFVLDASIAAVWALADEASMRAEVAANRLKTENALVPHLWWYEIRNILIVSERRQRMSTSDTAHFLDLLSSFPIQVDPVQDDEAIFRLARQYRLSLCDAAYLAIAERHKVPLATLDKDLEKAALAAGIRIIE